MKTNQKTLQYVLALTFCVVSCTSIKNEVSLDPSLPLTKSLVSNAYALTENEAVARAAQFFNGIENTTIGISQSRSVSSMNLSEKTEKVTIFVREIDSEPIPVYVINYAHKQSKSAGGYVILVGDKRIDKANSILAYSDNGSWGSIEPLMQNFLDLFWRKTDEFIKSELLGRSSSSQNSRGGYGHPPCPHCLEFSIIYYFDDMKRLSQPALWSQLDPYNVKLNPMCGGTGYSLYPPVGCVATAMGQIMAYHQKPTSGSYTNYLGTTVSTTYNWSTMTTSQYIGSLSSTGQEMVQNLLAEIGKLSVLSPYGYTEQLMSYGCYLGPNTGTGSFSCMAYARQGFALMGYTTAPLGIDYDYSAVVYEIDSNRPIFACGGGYLPSTFQHHAWVMDGVNSQKVVEEVYWECPWIGGLELLYKNTSYVNYVYCNLGAEIPSNKNGFYNSSLFKKILADDTVILIDIN